ncbi:MAG: hypothetical protein H6557_04010 [Lewinellaceae bacterium]|nr:hypothetical protein [Phaeodactylibacter sp.]MCB9035764.1 hypothetical protein [Lewinellaceae bacterium]
MSGPKNISISKFRGSSLPKSTGNLVNTVNEVFDLDDQEAAEEVTENIINIIEHNLKQGNTLAFNDGN